MEAIPMPRRPGLIFVEELHFRLLPGGAGVSFYPKSAKIKGSLNCHERDDGKGEGHKALVFSQFTSLLAIVRARLDRGKTAYALLRDLSRDDLELLLG